MLRPNDKIVGADREVRLYIRWLEDSLRRVIHVFFPNVREFNSEQVAPTVLFVEETQAPAPEDSGFEKQLKSPVFWIAVGAVLFFLIAASLLG